MFSHDVCDRCSKLLLPRTRQLPDFQMAAALLPLLSEPPPLTLGEKLLSGQLAPAEGRMSHLLWQCWEAAALRGAAGMRCKYHASPALTCWCTCPRSRCSPGSGTS